MLEKLDIKDFDNMFSLLEKSFPSDEYRVCKEQKQLFYNKYYSVYALRSQGILQAFISVWQFKKFAFIEHFAVEEKFRNCGIGARVLRETVLLLNNLVVLEVEPPDTEISKRRIAFYKRNGFVFNGYPYVQPPMSNGKKPVPLCIMTMPCSITLAEFKEIKNVLYKEVYKVE